MDKHIRKLYLLFLDCAPEKINSIKTISEHFVVDECSWGIEDFIVKIYERSWRIEEIIGKIYARAYNKQCYKNRLQDRQKYNSRREKKGKW